MHTKCSTVPGIFHETCSQRRFCSIEFIRPYRLSCILKWMNDRKDVCVLSVTSKSKWTEKIALLPCFVVDSFLNKGQRFFLFSKFFCYSRIFKGFSSVRPELDANYTSIIAIESSISKSEGALMQNWVGVLGRLLTSQNQNLVRVMFIFYPTCDALRGKWGSFHLFTFLLV